MPNLYPTLNLPQISAPARAVTQYKPAPYFDFTLGDFIFDAKGQPVLADGREAFKQWCLKTVMTERGSRLAYSDKIGAEWEETMKMPDAAAVKSAIIKTVTESILVHPAAQWVRNFAFEVEGDELRLSFEVKGHDWEFELTI